LPDDFGSRRSLNASPEIRERIEDELGRLEPEIAGVRPLFKKLAYHGPDNVENALQVCCRLLGPGGYPAFTDPVRHEFDPLLEVKLGFDHERSSTSTAEDSSAMQVGPGFEQLGRFTLPGEAWLHTSFMPMEHRVEGSRVKYAGDRETTLIIEDLTGEHKMNRRRSKYYARAFFVTRSGPLGKGLRR